MLKTVEGIYQAGQIQLSELPEEVSLDPIKLQQLIDQLETIAGIQQGLEAVDAGQTRSLEDFAQPMQSKCDISG
jgi:hypothetical protein